ncbi:hypothetical protein NIA69_13110 [Gemmiger formicilis]|nr:hypothetical protein [Gemmiger formicilis]
MAARFGGSFWKLQNEDANAQYYTSDFNSAEEMVNYGLALTQQVEAEGAALLMNNNNALPLAADAKVSTFSSSSVNLVYGGTGSGNIDASTADTLRTALERSVSPSTPPCGTSTPSAPARTTLAPRAARSPNPVRSPPRCLGTSTPTRSRTALPSTAMPPS